jgi:hypothetical protein
MAACGVQDLGSCSLDSSIFRGSVRELQGILRPFDVWFKITCGSSGRALPQQAQGSGFIPQYCQKISVMNFGGLHL